jgi:hypothetical protein
MVYYLNKTKTKMTSHGHEDDPIIGIETIRKFVMARSHNVVTHRFESAPKMTTINIWQVIAFGIRVQGCFCSDSDTVAVAKMKKIWPHPKFKDKMKKKKKMLLKQHDATQQFVT